MASCLSMKLRGTAIFACNECGLVNSHLEIVYCSQICMSCYHFEVSHHNNHSHGVVLIVHHRHGCRSQKTLMLIVHHGQGSDHTRPRCSKWKLIGRPSWAVSRPKEKHTSTNWQFDRSLLFSYVDNCHIQWNSDMDLHDSTQKLVLDCGSAYCLLKQAAWYPHFTATSRFKGTPQDKAAIDTHNNGISLESSHNNHNHGRMMMMPCRGHVCICKRPWCFKGNYWKQPRSSFEFLMELTWECPEYKETYP